MPTIPCASNLSVLCTALAVEVLELDAEDGAIDKVSGIFESVFHGLAMKACVDPQAQPEEGSASAQLIDALRELKNLHFAE